MLLYQQIEKNKRKSVLIVIFFILFILFLGSFLTYALEGDWLTGAIISSVVALIYVAIVLSQSNRIVMSMNRAQEIKSKSDHPFLWNTVEGLSLAGRIPMPKVFLIHDPSPNAFAAGLNPENASVAVTTGLMDRLNREEIEAVIAHEIAHVKNYDVRLATIAVALVSAISLISHFGSRLLFYGRRGRGNQQAAFLLIAFVLLLVAPFVALFIQLALSRNREYLADADGAALCRNPGALASALKKITSNPNPVEVASDATASLYIADPLKKKVSSWFSTHPPPDQRVERLLRM
ncbi:zinc metalloprotease HtpX [Heliorestis acidaminivorans]|uniref:Protease HtpX homolog n=1 Tax=Heliorestis acidaminivorans TaxID=553427 RepID=A0A6I0F067_9FIRM|nr:zinc metalloprotease HtpX [Heliorestis acidaminivorans]KAB2954326.1 zinc metalloprotease HtpX [Heliorestis acidaminivorans]